MELGQSLTMSGTSNLPALWLKNTAIPTLHLEDQSKERPLFEDLEKNVCDSQEASTSSQVFLYHAFIK